MKYFSVSDTGKVRKNNEDCYINHEGEGYGLFVVCDGMGGHNSGEVASEIAANSIKEYIVSNFDSEDNFTLISNAVENAHQKIYKKSIEDSKHKNMGTTVIIALIVDDILYFANAGDSRIYLYSKDNMQQLTKDHSYVQELLDAGAISKEEAIFFPRNEITSCLGTRLDYKLDVDVRKLDAGDMILLATDGLTDMIDDPDIENVLVEDYGVKHTSEILLYMANSTGGKDNITITCVKVNEVFYE